MSLEEIKAIEHDHSKDIMKQAYISLIQWRSAETKEKMEPNEIVDKLKKVLKGKKRGDLLELINKMVTGTITETSTRRKRPAKFENTDVVFLEKNLYRIAECLLTSWLEYLLHLGLTQNDIDNIKNRFPDDVKRQALEGMMQWINVAKSEDCVNEDIIEKMIEKLHEIHRQDIINLIMEMMEKEETEPPMKRLLRKRDLKDNVQGDTSYHQNNQSSSSNKVCAVDNMSFPQSSCDTRQEENRNSITARVLHKSELKVFGNKIKKHFREFLLFDGNNYIEAIAFREIAKDMDKRLEKDRVYCLSGFKMKHSSTASSVTKLEFSTTTRSYIVSGDIILNSRKLNINEVIKDCRAMQKISVGPVIVVSVGPSRQPSIKRKFLKEIMFKDYTGRIIMNIWSNDENINFTYQPGDVLDLENVEVGVFNANCNPDVFITSKEYSKFLHTPLQFMKDLLINEDADELIPVEMSIKDLKRLSVNRNVVIIKKASIESIAKENKEMTFMNCNILPSHGKLETRDGINWFCKQCKEFVEGKRMVELMVEIVDESEKTIWVKLFNQTSKEVLGNENYQKFLKYGHVQQKQILREIEKNNVEYKFEICCNKGKSKVVKKIIKINRF